ncbi:DNA repair protein rad2 [Orbilia oligospora]|uniref:DNA repair protein rad2 n=1 Tax=Orbilia oligospora TaxID=2813651 RepID=A0A7C8RGF8_ORBOL|nr:DNA repair protein rad2 [Orbilia oligospora]
MGVTGLWTVVQPVARPVKLETLAQKRLAIDASIWIYQFLKAVRDKEGNALRNAHVVGFFRRIVKLLFHGIRPVFVFDGGAPLLKRQTIANRKSHRQDRKLDASNTAKKLLSIQMQKRAKEEAEERRRALQNQYHNVREEEPVPENPVYASQVFEAPQERVKVKAPFRRLDQYHLPEMDGSLEAMRGANDPRIMSMEELDDYARRFEGGEDINLYDFSKIDFDSPFFTSLPPGDQYNILNAARIRSRLRMGLSKEQLEKMFPNRLEFSRFQIDRVRERNELTQRLMHLNGMNDDLISVRRVAGEKDREYVLVKNEGAEGGWALGVVGQRGPREGETVHKAIVVDEEDKVEDEDDDSEDEIEFEDIPIEGLNRLPKLRAPQIELTRHRQTSEEREIQMAIRLSRQEQQRKALKDSEATIFIQDDDLSESNEAENELDSLFEDLDDAKGTRDEDEELRKAIALSLERDQREGEEEERALELALKMSLEQDDENDSGATVQPSSNSKPRAAEQSLNPNKPKFVEFDDIVPPAKSNIFSDTAPYRVSSDLHKSGLNKKHETITAKPANLENASITSFKGVDFNPFALEGDGFTLENAMEYPTEPSNTNMQSSKANDFSFDNNILPFESMKLGGLAGLQKRLNDAKANQVEERTEEQPKVPLPPWFAPEENSAFKAGKAGYQVDNYDREDETERIVSTLPEHLRPIENRASIQPKSKQVIVLSEDEDNDIQMVDLTNSKPQTQNELVALSNETNASNRKAVEVVEAISPEVEAQDSDEPVEWEASDIETGTPLIRVPAENLAANEPESEDDAGMDSEEEQLMHQMRAENEEHARFASTFNQRSTEQNAMDYERELRTLRDQQKKDRRDADEVTKIMITECQQLLQMFGIPYITAPMEAEAQCAELVNLGLVDGIVTDDSDIFLFGGTRVYKNMFNQAKYVECYLASDLENEYSLDRKKMIRLAHLLGSDYTEGLVGVGPVTALEVLANFGGGDDALHDFKAWWTRIQSGFRDPADDKSKLKKSLKKLEDKLFLPPSFPDDQVDMAYLNPEVDKDSTPFEWGVPDLHGLRTFLMATIGWTSERTDEVLVPVIRDMNRKVAEGHQVNLTNFFSGSTGAGAFAPRVREANKSKRMENALMSLHRQSVKRQGSNLSLDGEGEEHKKIDESSSTDEELQGVVSLNGRVRITKGSNKKAPAKKKRKTVTKDNESGSSESEDNPEVIEDLKQKGKKVKAAGQPRNSSGRGRGRGRGRAKKT